MQAVFGQVRRLKIELLEALIGGDGLRARERIQDKLLNSGAKEVASTRLGELVMRELKRMGFSDRQLAALRGDVGLHRRERHDSSSSAAASAAQGAVRSTAM